MKNKLYFATDAAYTIGIETDGSIEKIASLIGQIEQCHKAAQEIFSNPDLQGLLTISIDKDTTSQIGLNAFSCDWQDWPSYFASNNDVDGDGNQIIPIDDGYPSFVFDGKGIDIRVHCEDESDGGSYIVTVRRSVEEVTDALHAWVDAEKNAVPDDTASSAQSM